MHGCLRNSCDIYGFYAANGFMQQLDIEGFDTHKKVEE